jgi:hypothetical protein
MYKETVDLIVKDLNDFIYNEFSFFSKCFTAENIVNEDEIKVIVKMLSRSNKYQELITKFSLNDVQTTEVIKGRLNNLV